MRVAVRVLLLRGSRVYSVDWRTLDLPLGLVVVLEETALGIVVLHCYCCNYQCLC